MTRKPSLRRFLWHSLLGRHEWRQYSWGTWVCECGGVKAGATAMKRAVQRRCGQPLIVGELVGGEYVRVDAGLVRITNTIRLGERWAILLRPDLSELPGATIYLAASTRVLEVLQPPSAKPAMGGVDFDPLQGGER